MNVLLLAVKDYSGSGYQVTRAIRRISSIDINLLIQIKHPYGYSYDYFLNDLDKEDIKKIFEQANILHIKSDLNPHDEWGDYIKNKPILLTVAGGNFRRHGNRLIARKAYPINNYIGWSNLRTAMTADLNYPEYNGVYIPHTIDSMNSTYCWKERKNPIIMHIPSTSSKKGTDKIEEAYNILKNKGYDLDLKIYTNISHKESIELKKNATIYICQISETGSYGNSGIEAMQFGIPTMAHISNRSINQGYPIQDSPIINVKLDVESIVNKFEDILKSDLRQLSIKTKEFCDNFHSYESVGEKYRKLYEKLYNNDI